ncbi:phage integrase central domain-containing protein [Methylobacterium soli]|uniref:phage integrase central domain-containing protein n=1 Tax=Methylobacterium soli TaxID=553447 RepID=UPI00177DCCEB|nr:hypothetical protein [Methylobacterium soli]GJE44928.1 hypothetical protein AEGHOMDF_4121 [Methylobacterium soli]
MASVAKREWMHGGAKKIAWVVRYTDQGGKRRLKTCASKKAADKERLRIEKEIEDDAHTPDVETLLFRDAAAAWLKDCDRRRMIGDKMATTTYLSYERNLASKVNPKIGNILISRLSSQSIQIMLDELSLKYKPNTLRYPYIVVQQVIRYARRKNWTKRDPFAEEPIRLPRTVTKVPIPSIADLENLLAASEQRGYAERELTRLQKSALVTLGVFAGMRRGEMAGLQWQFIDSPAVRSGCATA